MARPLTGRATRHRRAAWLGALLALGAVAATPVMASTHTHAALAPALGDWEGTAPHGLPFSFSLTRVRGRITISDLTVGDALYCPGRLAPTNAYAYMRATYIGPGALPVVRINWAADELLIRVDQRTPFEPQWDGRLLGPRRATLSSPAPPNEPRGCGWPTKRLTWRLAPAKRLAVKPGAWTGTVTIPGGSGTVSLTVGPSGRIVQVFHADIQCPTGGGGGYGVDPGKVGEFIAADGSFADANLPGGFSGRFAPGGRLTGTVRGGLTQGCGAASYRFTAHPA
jgi:hypothetical protein